MILTIHLPAADPSFRAGTIIRWHKQPGEPVAFGDDLCDVAIDEFVALQRTKRASLLGSVSRVRRRRVKDTVSMREGAGMARMRLTSAEPSSELGRILVPAGARCEIGALVAILGPVAEAAAVDPGRLGSSTEARIAANMLDEDDDEPDDAD